jgi:phytanoyl-CoA hydroxylase
LFARVLGLNFIHSSEKEGRRQKRKMSSAPSNRVVYIVIAGILALIFLFKVRFEPWQIKKKKVSESPVREKSKAPPVPVQEVVLPSKNRTRDVSANVDLSDFSIPQSVFAQIIKNTKSANTTDRLCHAPFVPITPERLPVLDEKGMPISDCWIDRPDAPQILEKKVLDNKITPEEAQNLTFFMENGYLILDNLDIDLRTYQTVDEFADSVWKENPSNLLVMNPEFRNQPFRLSEVPKNFLETFGENGTKLMEPHAHNPALLSLMLNQKLHRFLQLIYDDIPVAMQSSFLRVARNYQFLHRDPWYVYTRPPGNLMVSWVALEDVLDGSGELDFIVGSHKLPLKAFFDTKDIIFAGATLPAIEGQMKEMWALIKEKGLRTQALAPKKGQALIWHGNMIHGGGVPYWVTGNRTRKSFVVHYDLLRKRGSGRGIFDGKVGHSSHKLLRHDCHYALSDPMLEL